MKAKAKLITNMKEMDDGQKMAIKVTPKFDWFDVYFDPRAIYLTFITIEGHINVYFMNQILTLKYSDDVWDKVRNQLEHK